MLLMGLGMGCPGIPVGSDHRVGRPRRPERRGGWRPKHDDLSGPRWARHSSVRSSSRVSRWACCTGSSRAAIPPQVKSEATVKLASGVPFISNSDLRNQLEKASVAPKTAEAIIDENATARLDSAARCALGSGVGRGGLVVPHRPGTNGSGRSEEGIDAPGRQPRRSGSAAFSRRRVLVHRQEFFRAPGRIRTCEKTDEKSVALIHSATGAATLKLLTPDPPAGGRT